MGRLKGGKITVTYDSTKRQPLDSRMLVTKRADLINPIVWKTNTLNTEATYNGMIVSVNSDGIYNGVYYLVNRSAITEENYSAYETALATGENVDSYFSMWMKLGTLDDVATVENNLKELIGEIPEGKTIVDIIAEVKPAMNLVPVDGTIVIADAENGNKTIGVAIAPVAGNALVAVEGGLFVPEAPVKIASDSHGLVAVNGALTLNLATATSDGAMSREDKAFIDALRDSASDSGYVTKVELRQIQESVAQIEQSCRWGEM